MKSLPDLARVVLYIATLPKSKLQADTLVENNSLLAHRHEALHAVLLQERDIAQEARAVEQRDYEEKEALAPHLEDERQARALAETSTISAQHKCANARSKVRNASFVHCRQCRQIHLFISAHSGTLLDACQHCKKYLHVRQRPNKKRINATSSMCPCEKSTDLSSPFATTAVSSMILQQSVFYSV
jgi:hypothetical protein